MDFAGLSWLFTPKKKVRIEVWYLVGAWLLAATMNAILTWWSVSLALLNHPALGNEVIARESLLTGALIFVAGLVWLLRVLLIGTFTLAGPPKTFSIADPGPIEAITERQTLQAHACRATDQPPLGKVIRAT